MISIEEKIDETISFNRIYIGRILLDDLPNDNMQRGIL